MKSNEFIREAGRNGSMDDFGQPINRIPTDAEYAARMAAGQKNLQRLKDFGSRIKNAFFSPSVSLADGPADAAERAAAASGPAATAAAAAGRRAAPDVPAARAARAAAAAAPAAAAAAVSPAGAHACARRVL